MVQAQFTFTTNNGAITITGYTGSGGAVTIPDTINGYPVKTLGYATFNSSYYLTSVTMGTNLTTIGTNAFFQCANLASVAFTGSVTNVGTGPFYDCQSLTAITMSGTNTLITVTNNAIFNKVLTSLIQYPSGLGGSYTVPATVTNVGEAFVGNLLTALVVDPANLYFSSTNGVLFNKTQTQLLQYPGSASGGYIVPATATTIAGSAFEYSRGVTAVTIGTNVSSIGYAAFFYSAGLTAFVVNTNSAYFTSSNGVLFDKNLTYLIQYPIAVSGSYNIPGTVTNIADGAFGDAFYLTGVVIPSSVKHIGVEAFYACESLASVSIGYGVTNIDVEAFFYCPYLTSIIIPGSVTSIGAYAFGECALSRVCFEGTPPVDGGSIFYYNTSLTSILYVKGTPGWGLNYDGIATELCTTCSGVDPELTIVHAGNNVVLTWSADYSGFSLQSATNLVSPAVWKPVSPSPAIVNGTEFVTNTAANTRTFYRLMGP